MMIIKSYLHAGLHKSSQRLPASEKFLKTSLLQSAKKMQRKKNIYTHTIWIRTKIKNTYEKFSDKSIYTFKIRIVKFLDKHIYSFKIRNLKFLTRGSKWEGFKIRRFKFLDKIINSFKVRKFKFWTRGSIVSK